MCAPYRYLICSTRFLRISIQATKMKYLKSTSSDLRELFERGITVRSIAESLSSFDEDCPASHALSYMNEKNFDIIGVRQAGTVKGYAKRSRLSNEGKLADYLDEQFKPENVLGDAESLLNVFKALRNSPESTVFVSIFSQVGGIVTRGDLQKAPVRMWLFGLISLIEMQMLRIIREFYPGDSWQRLISNGRFVKVQELLSDRQKRNVDIDLADCLQFSDKRDILLKDKELWGRIWFESKGTLKDFLNELVHLRDELAHAQDIITGRWPEIVDIAERAESLLQRCEEISSVSQNT